MADTGATTETAVTADEPLQRDAMTGIDNPFVLAAYSVVRVYVPKRWDPSSEPLAVGYDINNRNGRGIQGRILYFVPGRFSPKTGAEDPVIVHRQALSRGQVRHACHELPVSQQWDGSITEGLEDRIGTKITAELAPVRVVVEVWNTSNPEPGVREDSGSGLTDVEGEYLARGMARAELDVFVRARWDRERVIPYDDPVEPELGYANMDIEVKNVADGTPVRLFVYRIGEVDDPWSDQPYMYTGAWPDEQPGLEGAVVRDQRVVLADGSEPQVRFSNHCAHWDMPGNNFYCFRVAFGDRGGGIEASERDYVKRERDCLHMRFTVFIHRPAGDLPEYTRWAVELHNFFRKQTKYYRSYLMRGSPGSVENWVNHFKHRYIVIVFGHAACGCSHADHPKDKDGDRLDPYHRAFPPDGNTCPDTPLDTDEARRELEEDLRHYGSPFGGCGNKSHVGHNNSLGKVSTSTGRQTLWLSNDRGRVERDDLSLWPDEDGKSAWVGLPGKTPRTFFWNGGCRTMLTSNMGEYFIENGTMYYHGWVYSPTCDYGRMTYDVFHKWIKGSKQDPAPTEFDLDRLLPAYRDAASRGTRPRMHPRIMDDSGVLSPAPVPDAAEGALK